MQQHSYGCTAALPLSDLMGGDVVSTILRFESDLEEAPTDRRRLAQKIEDALAQGEPATAVVWRNRLRIVDAVLGAAPTNTPHFEAYNSLASDDLHLLLAAGVPVPTELLFERTPDWPAPAMPEMLSTAAGIARIGQFARAARRDQPLLAAAAFRLASRSTPDDVEIRRQLARHVSKHRWDYEALGEWHQFVTASPEDAEGHFQLGRAAARMRLCALAVAELERAKQLGFDESRVDRWLDKVETLRESESGAVGTSAASNDLASLRPSAVRELVDKALAEKATDILESVAYCANARRRLSPKRREFSGRFLLRAGRIEASTLLLSSISDTESLTDTTKKAIDHAIDTLTSQAVSAIQKGDFLDAKKQLDLGFQLSPHNRRVLGVSRALGERVLGEAWLSQSGSNIKEAQSYLSIAARLHYGSTEHEMLLRVIETSSELRADLVNLEASLRLVRSGGASKSLLLKTMRLAVEVDSHAAVEELVPLVVRNLSAPYESAQDRKEQEEAGRLLLGLDRLQEAAAVLEPLARTRRLAHTTQKALAQAGERLRTEALLYLHQGDFERAASPLGIAVRLCPMDPRLIGLANGLAERILRNAEQALADKDEVQARQALRHALDLARGHPSGLKRIEQVAVAAEAVDIQVHARLARIDLEPDNFSLALEGARIARAASDWEITRRLFDETLRRAPPEHLGVVSYERARALSDMPDVDAALEAWEHIFRQMPEHRLEALLQTLKLLTKREDWLEIVRKAEERSACFASIATARSREQMIGWEIIGRVGFAARRAGATHRLAAIEDSIPVQPPTAIGYLLRAALADNRNAQTAAATYIQQAADLGPLPPDLPRHIEGERALHHARFGEFAAALAAFEQVPPGKDALYRSRLQPYLDVREKFGGEDKEHYPENLIELLLEAAPPPKSVYAPEPRQILMISGSLGQGGGEKQTVTVLRTLLGTPDPPKVFLGVRSIHFRSSDAFFRPVIDTLPVDWRPYGLEWETSQPSDFLEAVAGVETARLIRLLPHNMREEIVRISQLILEIRPQAVHIWQDMHAVAIACVLLGVPRYFIHRGSLSPDYWEFDEHQWAVHFRVMQYTYRRLAERPGFLMLNNSRVGCETDANWIGVPADHRFQVLYNAVDFSSLGDTIGPNPDLRRTLGIPESAPVVGGSFRLVNVKRPMFWMQAAREILRDVPQAHFVIIGGGERTEEVEAFASANGFRDRLHLPGRVSDVGAYYRMMDVKLLTSEREGIPNAIIEAQHFGVPVVATDVGGITEAISVGETGFAPTGGNPSEYAERVVWILQNAGWRAAAKAAAPRFVHDRFSLPNVIKDLRAIYGV